MGNLWCEHFRLTALLGVVTGTGVLTGDRDAPAKDRRHPLAGSSAAPRRLERVKIAQAHVDNWRSGGDDETRDFNRMGS